ncbi:MAG: HIT family protein [bacterium]|nr:HIT family protein [bacterium]
MSNKIWENEKFIAILDAFPNRKAMTLVISKEHKDSDISKLDALTLQEGILAVQQTMQLLKKKLQIPRVGMVIEGLEVNHLHFKLYPFWDNKGFPDGVGSGPQADKQELASLAQKIREQFYSK